MGAKPLQDMHRSRTSANRMTTGPSPREELNPSPSCGDRGGCRPRDNGATALAEGQARSQTRRAERDRRRGAAPCATTRQAEERSPSPAGKPDPSASCGHRTGTNRRLTGPSPREKLNPSPSCGDRGGYLRWRSGAGASAIMRRAEEASPSLAGKPDPSASCGHRTGTNRRLTGPSPREEPNPSPSCEDRGGYRPEKRKRVQINRAYDMTPDEHKILMEELSEESAPAGAEPPGSGLRVLHRAGGGEIRSTKSDVQATPEAGVAAAAASGQPGAAAVQRAAVVVQADSIALRKGFAEGLAEVLSRSSELQNAGGALGRISAAGVQVTPKGLSMNSEVQDDGSDEGRTDTTGVPPPNRRVRKATAAAVAKLSARAAVAGGRGEEELQAARLRTAFRGAFTLLQDLLLVLVREAADCFTTCPSAKEGRRRLARLKQMMVSAELEVRVCEEGTPTLRAELAEIELYLLA